MPKGWHQGPRGKNGKDRHGRDLFIIVDASLEPYLQSLFNSDQQRAFFDALWLSLEEQVKDQPGSPKMYHLSNKPQIQDKNCVVTLQEKNILAQTQHSLIKMTVALPTAISLAERKTQLVTQVLNQATTSVMEKSLFSLGRWTPLLRYSPQSFQPKSPPLESKKAVPDKRALGKKR